MRSLRHAVSVALVAIALTHASSALAQSGPLRFGIGPLQPTPADTKKAYEPFFAYLAKKLDRPYDLIATSDWAGIAVALANDQVDLAWMGPWGYILANNDSGATAVATVKYDGKPIYHAIVVCGPGRGIKKWPDDAKGKRVSFADVGSTSGWLIPSAWFKSRGIDPKAYFQYSDGASHPANEIAVASGQVDCATDFDRNRTAMIELGKIDKNATEVVWQSDPLPNDAIAVRKGFDPALAKRIQEIAFARELIAAAVAGLPRERLALHVCRGNWTPDERAALAGDYRPLLPLLASLPVGALFLELCTPRAGEIDVLADLPRHCRIGVGVVNQKRPEVERPEEIAARAERAVALFGAERVWLTPDCGFATFADNPVASAETAEAALRAIAEAAILLRGG